MPIVFADSRQLAEEWTYRFLAAAAAHHSAADRQRPVPDRLGTTAASALAVDRNLEGAADLPQAGIGETAEPFDEHPDRDALDQVEVDGRTTRDRVVAGFEDDLAGERADGCRAWRDLKPIGEGSESWQEWTALLLLSQADLLAGCESESGIDTLRLTAAGQRALDPSQRDPLDEATAKLRTGARVDAIVTAVERALGGRLKQLAANNGAATTRPDGSPLNLNGININLRGAGVYGEADRAQVEAWLKRPRAPSPDGAERRSDRGGDRWHPRVARRPSRLSAGRFPDHGNRSGRLPLGPRPREGSSPNGSCRACLGPHRGETTADSGWHCTVWVPWRCGPPPWYRHGDPRSPLIAGLL